MALSTVARSYSVRAPTDHRRQSVATRGNKRTARVAASAGTERSEGQTSRREVAKSVLLAAPLAAGLFPTAARAQDDPVIPDGCLPGPPGPGPAPVLNGIGQDGFAGYAIFKYLVPLRNVGLFVDAFIEAQKETLPYLGAPNPPKGIKDFTIFKESINPPSPPPPPGAPVIFFSVALFDTTQQGVDFICSTPGKNFVKKILDLGVQFDPAGATYQDKLFKQLDKSY